MLPCLKYIIHTHKFWGTNSKGTLLLTVFRYQIYTYSLWIDISVAIAYILNMNTNISSFDPTPPTFRGLYRQIIHVQANTQSVIALGRICLSWKINIYVPSRVKGHHPCCQYEVCWLHPRSAVGNVWWGISSAGLFLVHCALLWVLGTDKIVCTTF